MDVKKTRPLEHGEIAPDGAVDWLYEYDLYEFRDDERLLIVRRYIDKLGEASLLSMRRLGDEYPPRQPINLKDDLVILACRCLQDEGVNRPGFAEGILV